MMRCFKYSRHALTLLSAGLCTLAASSEETENPAPVLTRTWIVNTGGDPIPTQQLLEWKAVNDGNVGSLEGFYRINFETSNLTVEAIEKLLQSDENVIWFERKKLDQKTKSEAILGSPTEDPDFGSAWHITNAGQKNGKKGEDLNLLPAWDWGLDGSGQIVGVIDTGVEMTHPDLHNNIRYDLALDLVGSGVTGNDSENDTSHGTAVTGIIVAEDNELGAVGIAYGAQVAPIRYLGVSHSDDESAEVLSHQRSIISIYNNSWGPVVGNAEDNNVGMTGYSTTGLYALAQGVTKGRGGLGNIFVFSAGNDNEYGANVNYNSWANNRYTIAVAALGNGGKHSSYSEVGAPVLVAAPSGGQSLGIFTTDRAGLNGYNETGDYTSEFSGTSAAAPMVSGVVALMLEANPLLGWRDVQHVLAKTAIKVDAEDDGWKTNGAGLPFNDKYGFGRVDASSAIQTAVVWNNVAEEQQVTASVSRYLRIPDTGVAAETTLTISQDLKVEHVYVTPTLAHNDWGDLRITLISPSGTESVLAEPHEDYSKAYTSWTYTSVQFWDESSYGVWKLRIEDLGSGGYGSLSRWSLQVFGTEFEDNANQDPVAADDDYLETTYPLTMQVLANDSDPDGDAMQIISLYQPEFGETSITENEEIVYTPDEDSFLGIDAMGYTVADGRGGVTDALITVTHPGPVAIPDQAVTVQGKTISIPVMENDFDRSDDEIALVAVEEAEYGSAAIDGDHITFEPASTHIGYEDFKYTITDNNDGEKSGNVRVFTSSDPDFALLFDGIDDYAGFVHSDAFNLTTAITIEGSFYLKSYGEYGNVGFGRIIDRDTYSLLVNGEEHAKYPDHCLVFAVELPSGSTAVANTEEGSIELNRWYRVAVTYDSSTVRFYIDGKQVETHFDFTDDNGDIVTPFTGPITTKTADLYIGENEAGTRAFDGIIDWVRVWNKSLTSTQVSDYDIFVPESERSGLIGWFQFNEGVGWQSEESMGNGGLGVVSEALWVPKDPSMLSTAIAGHESR